MYKIEDYLIAYDMNWALPLALMMSITLCAFEFALGFALLLNLKPTFTRWMATAIMSFFTVVTLFDALYNPVPDCGCFGDAIKLTNWETFYKNLVLMVFILGLILTRKHEKPDLKPCTQWFLLLFGFLGFSAFSLYSYRHLPVIDFLNWKTGKDMYPSTNQQAKYYVTYRNNTSGETKEYESNNYPFNDSVWMSQWSFVEQRIDDPNAALRHDLQIVDASGDDVTDQYIHNHDYQFIITLYHPDGFTPKVAARLNPIIAKLYENGSTPVILTAALPNEMEQLAAVTNHQAELLNADDIVLKTMVRANPGVMLMKDGIVLAKWNWRDTPDFETLQKNFPGFGKAVE